MRKNWKLEDAEILQNLFEQKMNLDLSDYKLLNQSELVAEN